jgi:hypothetical protein
MSITDSAGVRGIFEARGMTLTEHELMSSDNMLGHVIWKTASELQDAEQELVNTSLSIERDLERMRAAIGAGQHVNSMGVLQSTGVRLDQAATKREQLSSHLSTLCAVFVKQSPSCIRECGNMARPGEDDCQPCATELVRQQQEG